MANKLGYLAKYDQADRIIPQQANTPALAAFDPVAALNRRLVPDKANNPQALVDLAVSPRGSKQIIWSSEGYTALGGIAVPTLTGPQRLATGSQSTNISLATIPPGITYASTSLDVSAYRSLLLIANITGTFTGTSLGFEIDFVDDAGTPNSIPIWKPAVATATGGYITNIAPILGTAPSNPTGWTITNVNMIVPPQITFKWTAVSMTVVTWTAFLYGQF